MRTLALLVLTAIALPAQDPEKPAASPPTPRSQGSAIPASEVVVQYVAIPGSVDPDSLYSALQSSFGRNLYVHPADTDPATTSPVVRQNIHRIGRMLVVQDTRKNVERILAEIPKLTQALAGPQEPDSALVTEIVTLKAGEANELVRALRPYQRSIRVHGPGGITSDFSNLAVDNRTNSIILRDTAEQVREMKDTLAALDVPLPEERGSVTFTFHLLRGADAADGKAPEELVSRLREVMPFAAYELLGTGLLRATADGRSLTLQMNVGEGQEMSISLNGVTTTRGQTPLIRISELHFDLIQPANQTQPSRRVASFRTGVSLADKETTVIGAFGDAPYFLVVRASLE